MITINIRDKMKIQNTFKKTLLAIVTAGALAITGCSEAPIPANQKYNVERLISNYNGWSIQYTDSETKEIKEIRFKNDTFTSVKVFRDLKADEIPYAERSFYRDCPVHIKSETIIHVPENFDNIIGGDNLQGGKYPVHHRRNIVNMQTGSREKTK